MNQDVDFSFLLPKGNIFPKTLYKTDRFKHIFHEAQKEFSLGNVEQGKRKMDLYFERVYLFDTESFFCYSKVLKEKGEEELSQLYSYIGTFSESLGHAQSPQDQTEFLKTGNIFIEKGYSDPLLLAIVFSLSYGKNIPLGFSSYETIIFAFASFLHDIDSGKISEKKYTILFEEDFLLKPLFLETLGRELQNESYIIQSLQYENISFQSNNQQISSYRNSLISLLSSLFDERQKLLFLIYLSYFDPDTDYFPQIIEKLFSLPEKQMRQKTLQLLGIDFFGEKLFSLLLAIEDIDSPSIDIAHISQTYISFANDKYYHSFLTNKIFFSYVYRFFFQNKSDLELQYDFIIETLTKYNLIEIFQKYDTQKIIFRKSKYSSKEKFGNVFQRISFLLTIMMFLTLLFGFIAVFIIIF